MGCYTDLEKRGYCVYNDMEACSWHICKWKKYICFIICIIYDPILLTDKIVKIWVTIKHMKMLIIQFWGENGDRVVR